jgi:mediator of RNA polymerase II transcription subunit 10
MHSSAQNCNIPIPLEVVRFIDDGRNPDEFTKDLLNSCVQRNQATKGKVDAFKALRKNLLEEIEDAFPEETEAYRLIRTQAATEARRALQSTTQLSNGDLKVKSEH